MGSIACRAGSTVRPGHHPAMPQTRGLTLFVDADDTLWENNIYYDAVVADYLALAQRHGCAPEQWLSAQPFVHLNRR